MPQSNPQSAAVLEPPDTASLPGISLTRWALTLAGISVLPGIVGVLGLAGRVDAVDFSARERIHHLIEWTSFVLAGAVFFFGSRRFLKDRDLPTMAIAVGLLLAGTLDGMHALQSLRLLPQSANSLQWCALNWEIGRTVQVGMLFLGMALAVGRTRLAFSPNTCLVGAVAGSVFLLSGAFVLSNSAVPQVVFPAARFPRPWDLAILLMVAMAGLLLLRKRGWPSAGALQSALLLSMIPLGVAQLTLAVGAQVDLGYHVLSAHLLKLLAYALPLIGVAMDYRTTVERDRSSRQAVLRTTAQLRDTERRSLLGQQHQDRQVRGMFESSLDAIFLVDAATYEILDVNPMACRLLGYSHEEFEHLNAQAIHPDEMERLMAFAREAAALGGARTTELSCLTKDGRRVPAEVSAAFFRSAEGRDIMVATVRDLTRMRAAEEARQRLEQELAHAERLQAVGRLAAGVAHDFNNLLTIIVSVGEEIANRGDLSPDVSAAGKMILEAGSQAASLTQQLLAFSRRQPIAPIEVDLPRAIARMEPLIRQTLPEGVRLAVHLPPDPHIVKVDPGRLDQVVMNLSVNAKDAMPDGGLLALHVFREVTPDGGRPLVALEVRDTGQGIPGDVLPHIFEPFYTSKERGRGTGLGLAIVHGIVQQHGGEITVHSVVGQGTTFRIAFPELAPVPPDSRNAPAPAGTDARLAGMRIVVVEDDHMVRATVTSVLEQVGARPVSIASALDAIDVLEQQPSVGLLITDVVLPGMDGIALAQTVQARWPQLPILVMSGYYPERVEPPDGRHFTFLAKPFSREDLVRAIHRALTTSLQHHMPAKA